MVRARLAALALAAVLTTGPVRGDDLPAWPNEQQALLRETEDQLIHVQHELFAARQQGDQTAVAELSKQFKELQDKRRRLITVTKDQLPSE